MTGADAGAGYRLLLGDAVEQLRTLPSGSVQMCCSSPPYLNLRSYLPDDHPDKGKEIGAEATLAEYVQRIVEVFREVRRVLHPSGVLFLNLGDSYNGSGGAGGDYSEGGLKEGQPKYSGARLAGLKPKDLIGVPWECAFALRADGWYLRADIIWSKKNCMPESALDRPSRNHEYLFLLSKNKEYYYNADAVREPHSRDWEGDMGPNNMHANGSDHLTGLDRGGTSQNGLIKSVPHPLGRNKRSVWSLALEPYHGSHYAVMPTKLVEPCILAGSRPGDTVLDPFFGSGTVGAVALKHGRRAIGIDLDERNIALAEQRIAETQPLLFDVTA
jgi:DNA modification methylase